MKEASTYNTQCTKMLLTLLYPPMRNLSEPILSLPVRSVVRPNSNRTEASGPIDLEQMSHSFVRQPPLRRKDKGLCWDHRRFSDGESSPRPKLHKRFSWMDRFIFLRSLHPFG
ncbi:Hypothetical protein NTJ_06705 [Nesidiocoris tenuis]|uniref:Uncharacterized protein n=1 Tax=Nesidiocoris tenuis TaxID=355587 RepID=A0ABN7ANU1_9HEMI|nr:Hypothetical protein NTJ_06705 [Nesidiocoris tenuis]